MDVCSQIAKAMMEVLEELEKDVKDERIKLLKAYLDMLSSCVKGADTAISLVEMLGKGRLEVN
ncbi:hypothetical protein [Ignicoccus hospitalis]|uniref:hypothetical protein n=1 Tax=Ignicoccus hospitalis TaxID=160233 RepID=UPI0003265859|nr:hypothetical protein [Ignicoccus hospitalis]HIH90686.1 hypothetical protein [Desulfurococcaceae archaeon]